MICLGALLLVIGTVIYGFWLRATWAHGYYLAVVVAVMGALVILIGLAQQAIAARDAQTWRAMAEWQVHAARRRIGDGAHDEDVDPASTEYYELLIGTLVRQAADGPDGAGIRAGGQG